MLAYDETALDVFRRKNSTLFSLRLGTNRVEQVELHENIEIIANSGEVAEVNLHSSVS
jgi:hypothetical protein